MRRCILFGFLFPLAACAAAMEQPTGRAPKELLRKPDTVHEFIVKSFEYRHFADAYKALSPQVRARLPFEAFYSVFASWQTMRGLFLKSEQHGEPIVGDRGVRIRVCNRDYGFREDFDLVPEFNGRLWTLDISEEQQNRLQQKALDWWDHQYRATGDFYVYARGQEPPKVWGRCPCD